MPSSHNTSDVFFSVDQLSRAIRVAGIGLVGLFAGAALAEETPATAPAPSAAEQLEEVEVTGDGSQVVLSKEYAGGQVARGGRAGILGNLDMMDSPFSSTSYTGDLMLNQQSVSVADVLQNDPTVRVAKGFGNFQELYMIRGFPVFSDDMTYNGVYGILPRQFVASQLLERVEVFRGASAFLNGAAPGGSGLGGGVNLVPKHAPEEALTRVTAGVEGNGNAYGALDVARRFGDADSSGIRVNLLERSGETAIEDQDRALSVFSLGYDYSGERLRLSADLGYQNHRIDAPRPAVTPWGEIPEAPDADSNFAQPWTYTDEEQLFGVVRGEYDLTETTTAWIATGMRDGSEANVLSNPSASADGVTSAYRFDNAREDKVLSGEAGVRTSFDTGSVGHTVTVSVATYSLESANAYAFSNFAGFAGDLYNPTAVEKPAADFFVGGSLSDPNVTEETDVSSVAISDMVSLLDDRLLVSLGVRQQNIETGSFNYNTGAALSSYDESALTPVAAVVFKPSAQVSVYANYIEGLVAGDVAPEMSGSVEVVNAGEVMEPYKTEQFETGVKYDAGNLGGTLSAFTTSKPSSYVQNGVFDTYGEQRNRGLELSVFGQPLESLRLIGGATWLNAEMTRTAGGLNQGKDAIGAPELQFNINAEWDLTAVPGLTLEARGIHTGSQYADAASIIQVDSWNRFDLGARYLTQVENKDLTLKARVQNVSDENNWVSVGGYPGANYLVLGQPRTFLLSASVEF
ncbi:TonB-dependent receptor [Microbulbifer bruguierae]|uniref:TonB-dependent receptor n=1 Tax=Microbulbifer bruguierae TaxID=3029061 RepID=A0ABY8NEP1_9GAMM|nr:TonB-dependent receptor [Microbulbifer bruguierae]WGL16552.1 TonB-dependent receptor [Microbulbifer bruguierae]